MAAFSVRFILQPSARIWCNSRAAWTLGGVSAVPARSYGQPSGKMDEKITHTGQVFEEGDYRKVRFVGRQKEVNEQFAINLIAEEPPIEVEESVTSCDGGGGPLGHPRVYINLDNDAKLGTCGYCGLRFKRKHHH